MEFTITGNGYDTEQVDAYITRISETYKAMHGVYQDLEERCAELTSKNEKLIALCKKQTSELSELHSNPNSSEADTAVIGQVLVKAQRIANQVISQARRDADDIVAGAHEHAKDAVARKREIIEMVEKIFHRVGEIVDEIGDANESGQVAGGAKQGVSEGAWTEDKGTRGRAEVIDGRNKIINFGSKL